MTDSQPSSSNGDHDWLPKRLGSIDFADLTSARQHSQDFSLTRADYIARRLRFMLLFFAAGICLWIPVDLISISSEHFDQVALARVTLSATLVVLWLFSRLNKAGQRTYPILTLSLAAVMAFYGASILILTSGSPEPIQAGYQAIPFLMIAMTGLFPLTVLMSLANIGLVMVIFIALAGWQGQLTSLETLNQLWVLALVSGCTLWIQTGQLLMLLKLYRESTRDPLTGLVNRRVLMNQLERLHERAINSQRPFSIMMFDLDKFKRINDHHGHAAGDLVLKKAAACLKQHARPEDIVARYGGEEFMLVMPGLNSTQSHPVAEQIRQAIEQQPIDISPDETLQVTTSIGLVGYNNPESVEQCIERADTLLYHAKQQGRNRICTEIKAPQKPA